MTIPADLAQFFGMSLRLAQELSYLFGAKDLWQDGEVDNDAVRGQLVLYCGVMFGVSARRQGSACSPRGWQVPLVKKWPNRP